MKEMEEEILTNWVCASTGWEWERSTLRQKEREKERKREMCVSGYHLWERKREQRKTWLCASVQVSHKGKAKRKVVRTARATLRSNLTDRIFLWARRGVNNREKYCFPLNDAEHDRRKSCLHTRFGRRVAKGTVGCWGGLQPCRSKSTRACSNLYAWPQPCSAGPWPRSGHTAVTASGKNYTSRNI